MFEGVDNIADIFRGGLAYYVLLAVPLLLICSTNPVLASSEFHVHRMSQFDVNGVPFGKFRTVYTQRLQFCFNHGKMGFFLPTFFYFNSSEVSR